MIQSHAKVHTDVYIYIYNILYLYIYIYIHIHAHTQIVQSMFSQFSLFICNNVYIYIYICILLINQTVTWGNWLSNTLANIDDHSATRKTKTSQCECLAQSQCEKPFSMWTTHLSVNYQLRCELPISAWTTHLSVNAPSQCERTFSMLNFVFTSYFEKP